MSKVPEILGLKPSEINLDKRNFKKPEKNRSIGHYILGLFTFFFHLKINGFFFTFFKRKNHR